MTPESKTWSDERLDQILGNLLRFGVLLAAVVVLAGGVFYLLQHGSDRPTFKVFHEEPEALRSIGDICADAFQGNSRALIQLGVLLLIATPVARVVFSVFAFALQRDRVYVAVTLIVLAVLVYSLVFP